jgi:hypothetical protein
VLVIGILKLEGVPELGALGHLADQEAGAVDLRVGFDDIREEEGKEGQLSKHTWGGKAPPLTNCFLPLMSRVRLAMLLRACGKEGGGVGWGRGASETEAEAEIGTPPRGRGTGIIKLLDCPLGRGC